MTDYRAKLGAGRAQTPCADCGAWPKTKHAKSCPMAKRGRNNRKRGGAFEAEVARFFSHVYPDTRKVGPLAGPDDVIAGPLFIQCKKVAGLYPKRLDDLLTDTEQYTTADQYPALVLAHPGHERRHKLIVMDVRDFVNLLKEAPSDD
jgi:hypothetical protein